MTDAKTDPVSLGMPEEDLHFGGFFCAALSALAHLREAWIRADHGNKASCEAAIAHMLLGRTFREDAEHMDAGRRVLRARMTSELAADLWQCVAPPGFEL